MQLTEFFLFVRHGLARLEWKVISIPRTLA